MIEVRETSPEALARGMPALITVGGVTVEAPIPAPDEALAAYKAACVEFVRLAELASEAAEAARLAKQAMQRAEMEQEGRQRVLQAAVLYAAHKESQC